MAKYKHLENTARIVARLSGRVEDYKKQEIPVERISLHPDCTYLVSHGKTYIARKYYVGQPFIDGGPPTESDGYPGDEWTECEERKVEPIYPSFQHPNYEHGFICPVCKTGADAPVLLVKMKDADTPGLVECIQYHIDCFALLKKMAMAEGMKLAKEEQDGK